MTNEDEVAQNLYAALSQFYTVFPALQKNQFFITGESYGGHYVPYENTKQYPTGISLTRGPDGRCYSTGAPPVTGCPKRPITSPLGSVASCLIYADVRNYRWDVMQGNLRKAGRGGARRRPVTTLSPSLSLSLSLSPIRLFFRSTREDTLVDCAPPLTPPLYRGHGTPSLSSPSLSLSLSRALSRSHSAIHCILTRTTLITLHIVYTQARTPLLSSAVLLSATDGSTQST